MYSQAIKPTEGKFTPGFYNYGTFYLTLLRVSTDMTNAYGGGPHAQDGSDAAVAMANYHRAGRIISLLTGSAIAWVVFSFLYRRTNLIGAIAGGFAVAIAPGLVAHSRFQTVDILAVFLLTLSLFCAGKVAEDEVGTTWMKWAAWAGVWAGLSAGTKYTGFLALIALYIVLGLSKERVKALLPAAVATLAALAAFVVSTPGAVLQSEKFLHDFKYEITHTSTGHGLVFAGTSSGFIYHFSNLMVGFGLLMTLIGAMGLLRAGFKKHAWAFGLLGFAAAMYFLIGRAEVKFLRYVFPLIPVLAIGFGWIVGQAHSHPNRRFRTLVYLGILALGGLGGGGFIGAGTVSQWMASEDPRDESARWIESHHEIRTVGLVQDPWFYSPSLFPDSAVSRAMPMPMRLERMTMATSPRVVMHIEPGESPLHWDSRLVTIDKPDAVVMSSFEYDDVDRLYKLGTYPSEFEPEVSAYRATMTALTQDYEITQVWGVGGPTVTDLMYVRPRVWLWQRKKTDSTEKPSGSSTTSVPSGGQAPTP